MHDLTSALVAASPEAVLVSNGGGRVLLANPAAAALTGLSLEQLVGTPMADLLDHDLAELVRRTVHETCFTIDQAHATRGTLRTADGRSRPVDTTVVRLDLHEHPSVALYLRPLPCEPSIDELTAIRHLLDAVVADRELHEVLDIAARSARELFEADGATVSRLEPDTDSVEVVAACGSMAHFLGTRTKLEGTRVQAAMTQGTPVHFVDRGLLQRRLTEGDGPQFGELWIAPITVDGSVFGALNVATRPGNQLSAQTGDRLAPFVEILTLALEVTEAARHRSALAVVADHERIARDLHDVVIQRLIAAAMRLEAMLHQVDEGIHARLSRVIDDLDRVTRDIRSTVFHLQRDDDASLDLTRQITDISASTGDAFGLSVRCHVEAGDDGTVPDGLKAHLLAATREALSNVGRHAEATEVDVEVRLDDPLVLTVIDNGVGVEPGAQPGNGLRNLAARAQELGGALTLRPASPSGTILRWEVPWPPTAGDEPGLATSLR